MRLIFQSMNDAALREIIGRHRYSNAITGQDADAVHPHFTGQMSNDVSAGVQPDFELGIGQSVGYFPLNFDRVFIGQSG